MFFSVKTTAALWAEATPPYPERGRREVFTLSQEELQLQFPVPASVCWGLLVQSQVWVSHPTIQLFSDVAHRSGKEGDKHSLREFPRKSSAEGLSGLATLVANRQTLGLEQLASFVLKSRLSE